MFGDNIHLYNIPSKMDSNKKNSNIKEITNENLLIDRTTDVLFLNQYSDSDEEEDQKINDTLEEAFMYKLDKTWESGDIKYAEEAIKEYNGLIHPDYIAKARNTINELIIEKMENVRIQDMQID